MKNVRLTGTKDSTLQSAVERWAAETVNGAQDVLDGTPTCGVALSIILTDAETDHSARLSHLQYGCLPGVAIGAILALVRNLASELQVTPETILISMSALQLKDRLGKNGS